MYSIIHPLSRDNCNNCHCDTWRFYRSKQTPNKRI